MLLERLESGYPMVALHCHDLLDAVMQYLRSGGEKIARHGAARTSQPGGSQPSESPSWILCPGGRGTFGIRSGRTESPLFAPTSPSTGLP